MSVRRKKLASLLLGSALALVLVVLGLFILLPHTIEKHYLSKVESLTGFSVSCGYVSSRGFWIKFHDLEVCSEDCGDDDPLVMSVGLVRVLPDFSALLGGTIKPARIEISRLDLRADLSTPESSDRIASALAELEKVFRSKGGGSGRGGKEGPKKGSGSAAFPVETNYVNLDIRLPGGMSLKTVGAYTEEAASSEKTPEISLGRCVFTGPGVTVEADDLRFSLGPAGLESLSLIRPVVSLTIPEGALHLPIPDGGPPEAAAAGKAPAAAGSPEKEYGPRLGEKILSVLLSAKNRFSLAAAMLPAGSQIQVFGGSVQIREEHDPDPLWELGKVAGSLACDAKAGSCRLELFGDQQMLPFSLGVDVGEKEVRMEADLPQVALRPFQGAGSDRAMLDLGTGRADVKGVLTLDMESRCLRYEGKLGMRDFTVNYYRLAHEPVEGVYVAFDGIVECALDPFEIHTGQVEMSLSGVPFVLKSFSMTRQEGRSKAVMKGVLPATDCQVLFSALPFEMRSTLAGVRFGGVLGADFDFAVDFKDPDSSDIDFDVKNQCEVVDEGEIKMSKFSRTFVHEVEDKLGKHSYVMGPGSDNWVSYDEISPYMVLAAITTEYGAFYHHKGISAFAIKRAVKNDLEKRGFFHGASTITMQLSKNLFLSREKTISRKLQEIILSWWLERSMNKDSIMELYLNVVEFGPEIYGLRSASRHYFNKEPADLTVLESVFLAKMLPNPVARYKYYKEYLVTGHLSPKWREVLERVTGKMLERGYISPEEHDEAVASEFHFFTGDASGENPYGGFTDASEEEP
jgi:hypothetical protein